MFQKIHLAYIAVPKVSLKSNASFLMVCPSYSSTISIPSSTAIFHSQQKQLFLCGRSWRVNKEKTSLYVLIELTDSTSNFLKF